MLDTYVLEALVAFADYGTLSEAANQLHTSQPALTRSMKKLEETLGVTLFVRSKNRMELNETGMVALEHARRVLRDIQEMERSTLAFDKSLHTINVGFCAPVPQTVLTPVLNNFFHGMTISSDMKDDADFCDKLAQGQYDLAVLHQAPNHPLFHSKKCGHEDLFLSLRPSNPLAFYPEIHLKDLDGKSVLLLRQIGFWLTMTEEKMPNTNFLMQYEQNTFSQLIDASDLPVFSSSYYIANQAVPGRIHLPIADLECHTDYYLVCRKADQKKYKKLFDYVSETTISTL